jgi:hypothetical protein
MKSIHVLGIAIAAAFSSASLLAQDQTPATPMGGMHGMEKGKHRQMMPVHEKLEELQKTQDAELDKLAAEMNAATGEKRVDAIVAVVNKLIEQRKAMHAEMATHMDR